MSKIYEKLQPLNRESGNRVNVKPPEGGSGGAAPKTGHTGVSLKRLCLGILIVIVIMSVLGAALPWYLSKIAGKPPSVRSAPDTSSSRQQPTTTVKQGDEPLQVSMVEQYDGSSQEPPRVLPAPHGSDLETRSAATRAGGGFITSVEVVTSASQSPQAVSQTTPGADSDSSPVTVVSTASTRLSAKGGGGVEVRIGEDGKAPSGVIERHAVTATGETAKTDPDRTKPKWTAADDDFTSDFERAVQLQRSGQYEDAIDYYEKYLVAHVGHAGSHNNLGIIYQHMRDYDRAVSNYNIALAADPTSYRIHNNLAMCHILKGNYARAADALNQSLTYNEDNYEALVNMGVTQTALRRYGKAEEFLVLAADKYPAKSRGIYNLGYLYQCRGEYDKAANYYRIFLEKSAGRYPDQEKEVGRFLQRLGEPG